MTFLRWREHPAAREEFLDALMWYEEQEPGLGSRLADVLSDGTKFLRAWPDVAQPYRSRARAPVVRSWSIGTFPYRIIYVVRDDEIVVVAYAHERRRPGYWHQRLEELAD